MRDEGLVYDAQSGGFSHIYSDAGKVIIDRQTCQREHSMPTIVSAQ